MIRAWRHCVPRQSAASFATRPAPAALRTTFPSASVVRRRFSTAPAVAAEKEAAPPVAAAAASSSSSSANGGSQTQSKPRGPGVFARTRSFGLGVLFASGLGFWIVLLEGQKALERLESSVQKVMEYQARVEKRLDRVETTLAISAAKGD